MQAILANQQPTNTNTNEDQSSLKEALVLDCLALFEDQRGTLEQVRTAKLVLRTAPIEDVTGVLKKYGFLFPNIMGRVTAAGCAI